MDKPARTWWKFFQKRVVHTKLDIYVFVVQKVMFPLINLYLLRYYNVYKVGMHISCPDHNIKFQYKQHRFSLKCYNMIGYEVVTGL
jgi:hypothetical protein